MHPSSELLLKRWSTSNPPILPFLAPRVFQPWPVRTQTGRKGIHGILRRKPNGDNVRDCPTRASEVRRLSVGARAASTAHENENGRQLWSPLPIDGEHAAAGRRGTTERSRKAIAGHQSPSPSSNVPEQFKPGIGEAQPIGDGNELWSLQAIEEDLVPEGHLDFGHTNGLDPVSPDLSITRGISGGTSRLELSNDVPNGEDSMSAEEQFRTTYARHLNAALERFPNNDHHAIESAESTEDLYALDESEAKTEENARKLVSRPKPRANWVSRIPKLLSTSSVQGREWYERFANSNLRYENFVKGLERPDPSMDTRNSWPMQAKQLLINHESSISLRESWLMIPEARRQTLWPELMCTVMETNPDSALKVLSATYCKPYPPGYAMEDCLAFIVSHYLDDMDGLEAQSAEKIFETISQLLRSGPPSHLRLRQNSIWQLATKLEVPQVRSLYHALVETGHPFKSDTLIQFASRFSKGGETYLAIEILQTLHGNDENFNSAKLASVGSSLLAQKNRSSTLAHPDSVLFETLLKLGMKPNIIHFMVLIQNNLQNGDHTTAWQIHDMMIENGIEANEFTYSLLLNDAKWRLDHATIQRVMSLVAAKNLLNPHILTDFLHTVYLLHKIERSEAITNDRFPAPDATMQGPLSRKPRFSRDIEVFQRMLPVYCRYFKAAPLLRILPSFIREYREIASILHEFSSAQDEKLDPPGATLNVMLIAFLDECTEDMAQTAYRNFRALVRAADPAVAELTSDTLTYNLFIVTFSRFHRSLNWCPRVLEDMLRDHTDPPKKKISLSTAATDEAPPSALEQIPDSLPSSTPSSPSSTPSPPVSTSPTPNPAPTSPPLPDIRTWSTLLFAFARRGQTRAAEKTLSLMTSRGLTPNLVTFNSLVAGYAALQDTAATLGVLRRLEGAGLKRDERTMRALVRLRDRRGLVEGVRVLDGEREREKGTMGKVDGRAVGVVGKEEGKLLELLGRADGELKLVGRLRRGELLSVRDIKSARARARARGRAGGW